MSLRSTAKRWTYLLHRWLGIGGCLLMLLWFVSGMVMLFIGYPKLTPGERLAALPVLDGTRALQGLPVLPDAVQAEPERVALTTLRGEPAYVVRSGANVGAWSAGSGHALLPVSAQRAELAAAAFAGGPAFLGAVRVDEDRWTHSRGLDAHRPLYKVELGGRQPGSVYVSSHTGEVVLDAPYHQQRWNYVGAWLHWLYFLRTQSVDPVWTWVVIVLSGLCTVAAISGIVVGVWRWRFRGRYRSGAKTPYVEPWMRWHHLVGLVASAFVFSWIFSGLMSMNPWRVFDSGAPALRTEAMNGGPLVPPAGAASPQALIAAAGGTVRELRWTRAAGRDLVLARGTALQPTVLDAASAAPTALDADMLKAAVAKLSSAPVARIELLTAYDSHYYTREPHTMTGGGDKPLPIWRVVFADEAGTWAHVDPRTGALLNRSDSHRRASRWLFAMLHSWDWRPLLERRPLWDLAMVLLSLGGAALSLTGVVIGWRRLGRKLTPKPAARRIPPFTPSKEHP